MAFTCHVVLAFLCFYHYYFSFLIHIVFKFYIIRTYRSILIRNGCHHSQFVVEEAVAISETQVQLGFLANPVVSGSCCGTDGSFIRSTFSNQIDRTANGISIHIRGDYLAYFDGLYHIGRNKVELHITCVAFGRRETVAVDCYRTKIGRGSAYLSEAGFSLIVLYVNTIDTLQCVSDIGVREFTHLIG